MMVARGYGAAVLLNLLLERGGLRIHLLDGFRKRAREHAGFAARIDRNGCFPLLGHALNGLGQPYDRPGQRSRDQQRQYGRGQYRDRADQKRGVPDAGGRRHDHGVRQGLDHREPFGTGQNGGRERNAVGSVRMIPHDLGAALLASRLRLQMRKVGFPIVGLAEQRAELARTIRMNEIVARAVDDVDRLARRHR